MIERDETRERFLGAIADRLEPETIAEAHLFPPIRQGGVESGVAVLAVSHGDHSFPSPQTPTDGLPAGDESGGVTNEGLPTGGGAAAENVPAAENTPHAENVLSAENARDAERSERLTVYTAKYRLTVKGPERGKWEFHLQAEADAPLLTIDKVVRGVQQRSGDAEDPVRLNGEEFRALLPTRVPSQP